MISLLMLSVIGLGFYLLANQSKQTDSSKSEIANVTQTHSANSSSNSENVNTVANINSNITTPTPIPTLDKAQSQKTMNQYISASLKKEGLEDEVRERKFIYGNLDGDGVEDVAVQVDWVFSTGGNGYGTILYAFRNEDGIFKFIDGEGVGGKPLRNFYLTGIKGEKIYGNIETCRNILAQIGLCEPQDIKKGRTEYSLQAIS